MQGNMIKQQFEEILKDTKILLELEPFVKKWSFNEMLPHFEISSAINSENNATLGISCDVKPVALCEGDDEKSIQKREKLVRQLKEIMTVSKCEGDSADNSAPFEKPIEDQYDLDLEKTLNALQDIENEGGITQIDIDEFVRGLGGKPDGVDLNKTNIREWKHIFVEHWLDLYNLSKMNREKRERGTIKQKGTLPNIIRPKSPAKKDHQQQRRVIGAPKSADPFPACTFSRANLDDHFMTREERKNMDSSFKLHRGTQEESTKNALHSISSPYLFAEYHTRVAPIEKEKGLLTLRKEHHHETPLVRTQEKIANSAFTGGKRPQYKKMLINDLQASTDNFYGDRERQTKKIAQNNCAGEMKFKTGVGKNGWTGKSTAGQTSSMKHWKPQASVRPSSAVHSPLPLSGPISNKFSALKGKIR